MDNETRLRYYLGEMYQLDAAVVTQSYRNFETNTELNPTNHISRMNYTTLQHPHVLTYYSQELSEMLKKGGHERKPFLYCIGDVGHELNEFCFTKNRSGNDHKSVLLKCPNQARHWALVYDTSRFNDIPFDKKADKLVWRGITTGQPSRTGNRFALVEKYFKKYSDIDVGFSGICQGKDKYTRYKSDAMSVTQQLKHKYILMVEGNDKASGLNWALASNSLVFMPKPTKFSWLMEDNLIPDVHYILVKDDFGDLLEKVQWCNTHSTECIQIVKNAKQYMRQFMNQANENWLQLEILNRYFSRISLPVL
jgi:hypothetical protein